MVNGSLDWSRPVLPKVCGEAVEGVVVVGVDAVDVAGLVHANLGELVVVTYVDVRVRVDKVILEGHTPVNRDSDPEGVEVVAAGDCALRRFGFARYYRVKRVVN